MRGRRRRRRRRFLERPRAFREKKENATHADADPRHARHASSAGVRRRGRGATRVSARARRGAARRGFRGVHVDVHGSSASFAVRAVLHARSRALRHLRRGVHGRRRGARGARERGPGDGHRRTGVQKRGRLDERRRQLAVGFLASRRRVRGVHAPRSRMDAAARDATARRARARAAHFGEKPSPTGTRRPRRRFRNGRATNGGRTAGRRRAGTDRADSRGGKGQVRPRGRVPAESVPPRGPGPRRRGVGGAERRRTMK